MKKAVELYNNLKKTGQHYTMAYELLCIGSIDAYIENATEEEYEVIGVSCIEAFLKADECDLSKLCDCVSKKYADGEFTLDDLKNTSKWDLLSLMDERD